MNRNSRTMLSLLGVVVVMGALSWAAVPFYNWFCRVTGYGGTTNTAEAPSDIVLDEIVRVRFDSNTEKGMEWTFRPMQREIKLRIGETGLAFYEAVNNSDQPVTGTASFNVAPDIAGYYFTKMECFCFSEQTLMPGERVEMPVTFFVDPGLVTDRDANRVRDITLSYTFHRTEPTPKTQAALDRGTDQTATDLN